MRWTNGNKYSAKKTTVDGIRFDSLREARRYQELKLMQLGGVISNLTLQPEFEVVPKHGTERAVVYKADFQYTENDTGKIIVEDAKGMRTKDYIIKRKLFKIQNQHIEFREV